jgi:histidinol phosphatase-like PHP family hydrolase
MGARLVIGHGETLAEPVAEGTNRAYIEAGVDILAHPGLITVEECALAAEKGVFLEISTRKGHSLGNGHVASCARATGARLVVNTDTHSPGDLVSREYARRVALGAGLTEEEFKTTERNAEEIVEKILG